MGLFHISIYIWLPWSSQNDVTSIHLHHITLNLIEVILTNAEGKTTSMGYLCFKALFDSTNTIWLS